MPDHWAIDQLFPICPIHRLARGAHAPGMLADITCDSDGKIDHFVDKRDVKKILELHEVKDAGRGRGRRAVLPGVFLLGAYQEMLGDLHNLFGDTHVVHVSFDDTPGEGHWDIDEVIEGDTVEEVLSYVQYDHEDLKRAMRKDVEAACRQGRHDVLVGRGQEPPQVLRRGHGEGTRTSRGPHLSGFELDDEVDVVRGTRLAVQARRVGAGEHVGNAGVLKSGNRVRE
jgi:hypothetical protein